MIRLAAVPSIGFALFPVVALLANNRGQIAPAEGARALFLSLALGFTVLVLARLMVRSWSKAGLLASALIVLFYSYGHLYGLAKMSAPGLARHRYLLALSGLIFVCWAALVLRTRLLSPHALRFMNVAAVVAVVVPIVTLVPYLLPSSSETDIDVGGLEADGFIDQQSTPSSDPDIYFIVLDGYASHDVLKELFDFDNSGFIAGLESEGFVVAQESRSNYTHTSLSLASILNLGYVNEIAKQMGPGSRDLRPLGELIAHSELRSFLSSRGYQIVAFETGLTYTSIEDADIYLSSAPDLDQQKLALLSGLKINRFEAMLLETTAARIAVDYYVRSRLDGASSIRDHAYDQHRERVIFTISSLSDFAQQQGRFFVFAHVISPHPPFVFGSLGEEVVNTRAFSFQDDGCCTKEEYISGYHNQVAYISNLVELEIRQILALSDDPPIIILQGDHGPGSMLGRSAEQSDLRERFGILNAYYLPDGGGRKIYQSITPVNSFRLVLNEYFGAQLDLLADVSYFSPGARPYDLLEIAPSMFIK